MKHTPTHPAPIPDGMEQDARRYRFLRARRAEEGHFWVANGHITLGLTQWNGEELDNAIDKAMLSAAPEYAKNA